VNGLLRFIPDSSSGLRELAEGRECKLGRLKHSTFEAESSTDSCGPFKDDVVSLMATLAKQERLRISERTKAGLQRARRAGKVLGRPKVQIDNTKLKRLRDSGLSFRQIAAITGYSLSTLIRALQ
jgi:DNA invertase Pin-like site-specific DNA recombinase